MQSISFVLFARKDHQIVLNSGVFLPERNAATKSKREVKWKQVFIFSVRWRLKLKKRIKENIKHFLRLWKRKINGNMHQTFPSWQTLSKRELRSFLDTLLSTWPCLKALMLTQFNFFKKKVKFSLSNFLNFSNWMD